MAQQKHWRIIALFAALALSSGVLGAEQEKVQITGPKTIELPKGRELDLPSRNKVDLERPSLEGGFAAPPPVQSNSALEKKFKDLIDKKKNWIYANPYEDPIDNKEFLKSDKDNKVMIFDPKGREKDRSMVEKYISEKGSEKRFERGEKSGGDSQSDRGIKIPGSDETQDKTNGNDRLPRNNREEPFISRETQREGGFRRMEGSPFDRPRELVDLGGGRSDILGNTRTASLSPTELKKQQELHETEFLKMIQPRSGPAVDFNVGGPQLGAKLDGFTAPTDSLKPDFGPRKYDSGLNLGGGLQSKPSTFLSEGPSMAPAISRPDFGASVGVEDFSSKIQRPATIGASPAPSFQTPANSPLNGPRPFVFELPRRAF